MKVLVVRAGALGDLLLLRPVVASLRHAGAHVVLLAPDRPASALVGAGPEDAHGAISWDGPAARMLLSEEADTDLLRRTMGTYDAALCYSRRPELAAGLARIATRLLTQDPTPGEGHAADWLARPLARLGLPRVEPEVFRPSPEETAFAEEWCARLPAGFLAVHPGSGSPRKNWPLERFVELVRQRSPGRPWLLSLGPAEEDLHAPGAVVTRDLPPRRLGAILARAGLYAGNDSGVTHLAAAWGAPTLALFGPTEPETWAPRGPHVRVVRSSDGTMEGLPVETVLSLT